MRWFAVFLCGCWCVPASLAQALAELSVQAQLQILTEQRDQQTQLLDAQERACLARFAVNDCVREVTRRRRAMLARVHQEEAALRARERQARGQAQLERLGARAPRAAPEVLTTPAPVAASVSAPGGSAPVEAGAPAAAARSTAVAAPTVSASAVPRAAPVLRHQSPTRTPPDVAQNRMDYAKKQQDAADRRAARDKRLQQAKPGAVRLPTPP